MRAAVGAAREGNDRVDDQELAARAQAGDLTAYETLVTRYQRLVYRVLWSRGTPADDIEELAQDTFVRAWERLSTYDTQLPFKAWLVRVATNLSVDRYRAQMRRPAPVELPEDLDSASHRPGDDPAATAVERERQARLYAELRGLPDAYREALVLRFIEDLSYNEIAATLGIPLGSVKTRIFRGRELLKTRLYPGFAEEVE